MNHLTGKRKFVLTGIVVIIVSVLICCVQFGYMFVKHEKYQNEKISNLEKKVSLLQTENSVPMMTWETDNFNYLAIGNSITLHPKNEYWWNECGMAASKLENDFVHQLSRMIQNQKIEQVVSFAYNFSVWEVQSADRAETLPMLDGILSNKLDLVTIKLSENATDLITFESDYEELIRYVQKGAPNAKVIVVGDFWDKSEKDAMMAEACKNCGVIFVSLDEIKSNEKYQCGLGTTAYDENGNPHIVEHGGVAKHPGDEGMKWIAQMILLGL